jgi:hypothetical protein
VLFPNSIVLGVLLKTSELNITFIFVEELSLLIGQVRNCLVFGVILYSVLQGTCTGFINCICNREVVAIRLYVLCT